MQEENSQTNNVAPWATFCMTTYKRPEFLMEQIQTILKQTFTSFHIIISDNDPGEKSFERGEQAL